MTRTNESSNSPEKASTARPNRTTRWPARIRPSPRPPSSSSSPNRRPARRQPTSPAVHTERSALDQQRQDLEGERRSLADERQRDSDDRPGDPGVVAIIVAPRCRSSFAGIWLDRCSCPSATIDGRRNPDRAAGHSRPALDGLLQNSCCSASRRSPNLPSGDCHRRDWADYGHPREPQVRASCGGRRRRHP